MVGLTTTTTTKKLTAMPRRLTKLWKRIRGSSPSSSQDPNDQKLPSTSASSKKTLTEEDRHYLCQRLAANDVDLVTLDLSHQGLDRDDAVALSNALRMNENLCMLDLTDNELGDEGTAALLEGLQHHPAIEYLLLPHNGVGNLALDCGQAVETTTGADNTAQTPTQANLPLLALPPALKYLDVSNNHLSSASALLQQAALSESLETLDLSVNHIGNDDAAALGQALERMIEINLFANRLGDEACRVLVASGLGSSLQRLNLGYNRIGNEGARALLQLETTINSSKHHYPNKNKKKPPQHLGGDASAITPNVILTGNPITNADVVSSLRATAQFEF